MNPNRATTCLLLVGSQAAVAMAHPGHGEAGPTHYVTSVSHLATLGVFSAAVATLIWIGRRVQNRTLTLSPAKKRREV